EALVEALEQLDAILLPLLDPVELLFHLRGELRIDEVELGLHEPVDDEFSEERRLESPPLDLLDVVARLHLADDLGVRARAADPALFELAHERALAVAR